MNIINILDNKKCILQLDDIKLFKKLRYQLSYKMEGVEYTAAYQNGWNGMTYLLSEKGTFSIGLLVKVKKFLEENRIDYQILDNRKPIILQQELDISEKLKHYNLIPRDYQDNIVNACISNQRGIVRAATGSGKTLALALLTAKLNKPTTIYVIGLDLLKQFHDLFSSLFEEKIGYIGNGVCDIQRINIASIWTIGRALNVDKSSIDEDEIYEDEKYNESNTDKIVKLLKTTKVHALDECHLATTNTVGAIYKQIDPEHLYGFSGTPYRLPSLDLLMNSILGEQIIDICASELIEKGVLAQPIIKFINVPKMSGPASQYQTVYKEYVVENEVRNELIVKHTKELIDKKYTPLVLFKQIKHGDILYEMFLSEGIRCELLSGKDSLDKRKEIKDKLNNKEIDCILASTIFDIGIDLPILSALILSGGGKSSVRTLQRIGRVIRRYSGKKNAAIIDFYDNIKFLRNHSKIRHEIYCSEKGFKVISAIKK